MNTKVFLVATVLVMLASFVIPAGAEDFNRAGKSEIYGVYQMMNGDTAESGSDTLTFDDSAAYGVGLGVNINGNFNLNTEFLYASNNADYSDGDSADFTNFFWSVNLDYYVFKDRLTPMVSGGIGFIRFMGDSEWHGWFGSIDETDFSYNFGAGVRWDATDNLFVKAMYKWTFTKIKDTDNGIMFDGFVIAAGLKF